MRKHKKGGILKTVFLPLLFVFCFIPFDSSFAQDQCLKCHEVATPKVVKEWAKSCHFDAEISCIDCHGGNPDRVDKSEAHSEASGFKGKFASIDIVKVCSDCHTDINRMKFYRLDTNIYNEYMTSVHGKLFLKGDKNAATCTSCHNTHLILRKGNPSSPTNKHNIPDTCGRCHSDSELMKSYGIPANQVSEYKEGIHGSILYGKRTGNPELVPVCYDCHGTHGAAPPEVTKVHFVCGTCHFIEQTYFMKSKHYTTARVTGEPECITCHGNHKNTIPAEGLFIDTEKGACNECHTNKDEPGYSTAEEFHKLTKRGEELLSQLEASKEKMKKGNALRIMEVEYQKAKSKFLELRRVTHSLSSRDAEDVFRELESTVKSAIAYSEKGEVPGNERWLKFFIVIGVVALFALGIFSLILSYVIIRLTRRFVNKPK